MAVLDDGVGSVDDELGDAGELGVHVFEHLGEHRHDQPQHYGDGDDRDERQDQWIHQRPLTLRFVSRDSRICLLSSVSTWDILPVTSPVRIASNH